MLKRLDEEKDFAQGVRTVNIALLVLLVKFDFDLLSWPYNKPDQLPLVDSGGVSNG